MKRDTQQKARLAVQRHINESGEQGKDLARRCDVCRATLYRFLSGEDISMAAVEKLLAGVGFKLDVVPLDPLDGDPVA